MNKKVVPARALPTFGSCSNISIPILHSLTAGKRGRQRSLGSKYGINDTVTYSGGTYTWLQAHTSLTGWEPANVPALWKSGGTTTPTPTTPPTTNGVTFYADINYGGKAVTLGVGN